MTRSASRSSHQRMRIYCCCSSLPLTSLFIAPTSLLVRSDYKWAGRRWFDAESCRLQAAGTCSTSSLALASVAIKSSNWPQQWRSRRKARRIEAPHSRVCGSSSRPTLRHRHATRTKPTRPCREHPTQAKPRRIARKLTQGVPTASTRLRISSASLIPEQFHQRPSCRHHFKPLHPSRVSLRQRTAVHRRRWLCQISPAQSTRIVARTRSPPRGELLPASGRSAPPPRSMLASSTSSRLKPTALLTNACHLFER